MLVLFIDVLLHGLQVVLELFKLYVINLAKDMHAFIILHLIFSFLFVAQ